MVITSPHTRNSSDNTTVASWKLGASFEIFSARNFFVNKIWPKAFILGYTNFFGNVFFKMVTMTVFFLQSMFFKSAGSISETIFIQSTQNFAHFLLLNYQVKYVRVFGYRKNWRLMTSFWRLYCEKKRTWTLNLPKCINIFNILKIWYVFY